MTEVTIEIQNTRKDEYGYSVPADSEELAFETYKTRGKAIEAAREVGGLGAMIYRYNRRYLFVGYRHLLPSTDYRLARAGATPVGVVGRKGDFISYTGK